MTTQAANIKVLLAKLGLDGHDRGVKGIARAMRDAGMEVVYMGMRVTPDQVAQTALQEDVDVVGISILSGAHITLLQKVINLLGGKDSSDIMVVVGGVVPDEDIEELRRIGVKDVLLQDTPPKAIVETMRRLVDERGPR